MEEKEIQIIKTIEAMAAFSKAARADGKTIGFVPTMGALHEGHLSLVRASQNETDITVVSIFVNPTQFSPAEDLSQYPRPFEQDVARLADLGVSCVFAPDNNVIYPDEESRANSYGGTIVYPPTLAKKLEGEMRPTHFQGVATIVLKLFNIVQPQQAFFGQKDFQQSMIVQQMTKDLNVPVSIKICPIVRDESGLALSSRNVYLSEGERKQALALSQSLRLAKSLMSSGESDTGSIELAMRDVLRNAGITQIDYTRVACSRSLERHEKVRFPAVCLVAAYVGSTRLIDNCVIENKGSVDLS